MMELEVLRTTFTDKSSIGVMSVNGAFECHTLEDVVREEKIMHETAIPEGRYQVIINQSNRFMRLLPLLLDVPGFEGVRIHPGNTDKDTSGCILVGTTTSQDYIGNSRAAFETLFTKMKKAWDKGEKIWITVKS